MYSWEKNEIIYFKILYLIHVSPLRRGTAAGGREGKGTAYPITSHPEIKRDLFDYVSVPISKERNSRDAHFYRGSTGENEEQDECLYTWRQGIRAAADSTIVSPSVLLMDRLSPGVNSLMAPDNG